MTCRTKPKSAAYSFEHDADETYSLHGVPTFRPPRTDVTDAVCGTRVTVSSLAIACEVRTILTSQCAAYLDT